MEGVRLNQCDCCNIKLERVMWEFFDNRHEIRVNGGSSNIVNKVEINGVWKHPAI